MAEFRINISNLSEGIHEYSFEAEPSAIGLHSDYSDKVFVRALVEKSRRQIFLRVHVQGRGNFVCDRCLDFFPKDLETEYSIIYVPNSRSMVGVTHEEKEVQVLPSNVNYIELDDDVRQFLILSIPQKLLCQENCQGICHVCGTNKNLKKCSCENRETDPRWEELKKITINKNI